MSQESYILSRSLRAVTFFIVFVAIVAMAAMAYSGYADFKTVAGAAGGSGSGFTENSVVRGSTAMVYINASISNEGLLPIQLAFACGGSQPGVECHSSEILVQPGQQGVLGIALTLENYTRFLTGASSLEVNGNFTFTLVPFATMQVSTNLASLVNLGGTLG